MMRNKRRGSAALAAALMVGAAGCGMNSMATTGGGDDGAVAADLAPGACELLSARLQAALANDVDNNGVPGEAAQVVLPTCTWSGAAGVSDASNGTAMKTGDQLFVASLTKTFTAVVMLQLVAEGKVGLDDSVTKHVPAFTDARDVTVRQLLNHTSGLYDYSTDRGFVTAFMANLDRAWKPDELLAYAAGKPATNARGTFHYCATNTILAGLVIEKVTSSTVAKELRARILDPLALRATYLAGFEPATPGTLSHGYLNGQDVTAILEKAGPTSSSWTTGSMVSTVGDLTRFLDALLVKKTLLAPAQLDEMQQMVVTDDAFKGLAVPGYGLGLVQRTTTLGKGLGNGGGSPGWLSRAFYLADRQALITVFINSGSNDVDVTFDALVAEVAR